MKEAIHRFGQATNWIRLSRGKMLAALSIGLVCSVVGKKFADTFTDVWLIEVAVGGVFFYAGTCAATWCFTRRARDEENREEPP